MCKPEERPPSVRRLRPAGGTGFGSRLLAETAAAEAVAAAVDQAEIGFHIEVGLGIGFRTVAADLVWALLGIAVVGPGSLNQIVAAVEEDPAGIEEGIAGPGTVEEGIAGSLEDNPVEGTVEVHCIGFGSFGEPPAGRRDSVGTVNQWCFALSVRALSLVIMEINEKISNFLMNNSKFYIQNNCRIIP